MASPTSISLRAALALLTVVRLAVNTGHRFIYPFLPAIARGVGIPLEHAGLLVSARNLAGMATPLVVATAGRGERRRRLAVVGLALFAFGAAVTAATGVFVGALVGFIAMGLAKPVYDVAAQSYLADRTSYARRARAIAAFELTWAASLLLGAPAAGWLIQRAGWRAPFWAVALLAALGAVAVHRLLVADEHRTVTPAARRLDLDRSSLALLTVIAVTSLGAETTFVVFGAWLEDSFGLTLLALGGASTAIALAELGGSSSVLAFADRIGKRRVVGLGTGLAAIGFAIIPFTDGVAAGLGALALGLFGFELTIVAGIPLATEVRPGARSRYLALLVVAVGIGRTIGAALGPVLFTTFDIGAPAAVSVAANLLGLVIILGIVTEHVED